MPLSQLSASFQSLSPLPRSKLGPSGADSQVGGFVHILGSCGSLQRPPVRLGVSPAAASTPTGVFNQRFEALFPRAGALGCAVCFAPPRFLPVYLCANVGPRGLLAAAWPAPFIPQSATSPGPPASTLPGVLSTLAARLCPSYQSG